MEKKKKGSWQGWTIYSITAVFNKKHSIVDVSLGNFSKHPAELKGQ